jgi:hypothetical protein
LNEPEIGIALGDLMYALNFYGADPQLPRTGSQLSDSALTPLDPGTMVIQFPKAKVSKGGEDWRLVLTEFGQWGYAAARRNNDRRIIAQADIEAMLKDYAASRRSWIFIKEPIPIANGAVVLTRGEFYPLETSGVTSVIVDRNFPITRSKFEQIEGLTALPPGVSGSADRFLVSLGNEYKGKFDYLDLTKASDIYNEQLDPDMTFARESLRRARQAMRTNAKFISTQTGERLECNQVRTYQSDASKKQEWSAKVGADVGKFLSSFASAVGELGISLSAEASFSGDVQEKTTLTATESALSFDCDVKVLEQAGSLDWLLIGNSQNCEKNPADNNSWIGTGARFFRVTLPGIAGSLIDKPMFEKIAARFPDIAWNQDTGKLRLSCRQRDYQRLLDFLKNDLELDDPKARLILQQITVVKKSGFDGC